ncbi:lipocalin family protein [Tenacibaculum ovolyticum]|uniref:lipocalin family protein n=1 Tax=Tenacibaculum ovolyticum TaxID=104270 RepID=UPI0003FE2E40|nr:lipocalin family protein [Tenacibaculum ovolyticum]WBX75215.1 lipocalin family protein [Tenacibaculum ovolyticum]
MKKLLILSITILSLLSCSNNNDNLDPFIGTWSLFSLDGTEVSDCEKQTTITIIEGGTFTATYYFDEPDNTCLEEESFTGTWTNKGNNNYTTTGDGDTESSKIILKDNSTYNFILTEITPDGARTSITTFKKK